MKMDGVGAKQNERQVLSSNQREPVRQSGRRLADYRAIGGKWRATPDDDEHYVHAIAL